MIVSQEAQAIGLGVSLFERLTREGGESHPPYTHPNPRTHFTQGNTLTHSLAGTPSIMLDTQYRMHPSISQFPAAEFYRGSVRDGTVDARTGRVSVGLEPPRSVYFRALDLSAPESVDEGSESQGSEEQSESHGREKEIPKTPSVIFLDHAGKETSKDRSRVNHTEAQIIASVVVDLLLSNPVSAYLFTNQSGSLTMPRCTGTPRE